MRIEVFGTHRKAPGYDHESIGGTKHRESRQSELMCVCD